MGAHETVSCVSKTVASGFEHMGRHFPCTENVEFILFPVYDNPMLIVWDEPKRQLNLAKHGLDFADLIPAFFENARVESAKQDRFLALGQLAGVMVVAVVFRPLGSEAVSVISMRPASKIERSRA